jgi:hypothetical protein
LACPRGGRFFEDLTKDIVMRIHVLAAVLGTALLAPAAAFAADAPQDRGPGHYEWRPVPQFGPRSTGPAQKRVWVPDPAQMAGCDCAKMKMNADECMKGMHSTGGASSVG